jgi:hypothetical protein
MVFQISFIHQFQIPVNGAKPGYENSLMDLFDHAIVGSECIVVGSFETFYNHIGIYVRFVMWFHHFKILPLSNEFVIIYWRRAILNTLKFSFLALRLNTVEVTKL